MAIASKKSGVFCTQIASLRGGVFVFYFLDIPTRSGGAEGSCTHGLDWCRYVDLLGREGCYEEMSGVPSTVKTLSIIIV